MTVDELNEFMYKHGFCNTNNNEDLPKKYVADLVEDALRDSYTKAIKDVMAKAREIQKQQIKNLEQYPKRYGKQWAIYMNTHLGHIQVACKRLIIEKLEEQLKEGSADNE